MLKKLRVHIVPVGFELDRVVLPLIKYKADKVYLITKKRNEDKARGYLDNVVKKLKEEQITDIEIKETNMNDIFVMLNLIRQIINSELNNFIYINISAGSKLSAVAGAMSAMMFNKKSNIKLYYVEPENYNTEEKKKKTQANSPLSYGLKQIIPVPTYNIRLPDEKHIKLLIHMSKLEEKNEIITQKKLVEYTYGKSKGKKDKEWSQNFMKLRREYFDKLIPEWKLIEIEGKGRNSPIKLTDNGKDMIKFLKD